MATKWSAFSAGSAIGGTDVPVGLQSGGNVQWTWAQVRTFLLGTTTSILSIAAGKTLTVSKALTLDGTDSTTMTFPTTSATVARTDAANTFTGNQTVSAGQINPAAGTTAIAPIQYASGTNLTAAAIGAREFDGVQHYVTIDTSSGRGAIPVEQYVHLTADGSTISTIANFFGANSNISLVASGYYIVDIYLWFLNSTIGTVTWTLTNSAAPTSQNIYYEESPITGIVAPPGTATMLVGQFSKDATAARTVTTGTLTDATENFAHFKIWLQNGTGTSLKIQATKNVGGTITPRLNSYWTARRMSPGNVGTLAA